MPENPDRRPENELDPGASTQMFQAFVDRHESDEGGSSSRPTALIVGGLVALVLVLAIGWLVLAS